MNTLKLKAVMVLNKETGGDLAKVLGITRGTLSLKMNDKGAEFTQGEICKIKDHYRLSPEDVDSIFFTSEVSN